LEAGEVSMRKGQIKEIKRMVEGIDKKTKEDISKAVKRFNRRRYKK
jgi:hypothetical protein